MKLTGKCKDEFEKWYLKTYRDKLQKNIVEYYGYFLTLPNSMKYGVYVDFAEKYAKDNNQSNHILKIFRLYYIEMGYSLNDARIESVKKFDLIYNNYDRGMETN